jgi:hypothetical protein
MDGQIDSPLPVFRSTFVPLTITAVKSFTDSLPTATSLESFY